LDGSKLVLSPTVLVFPMARPNQLQRAMDSVWGPAAPRGELARNPRNWPYPGPEVSNEQAATNNLLFFLEDIDYKLNVIKMLYKDFNPSLMPLNAGHSGPDPRWDAIADSKDDKVNYLAVKVDWNLKEIESLTAKLRYRVNKRHGPRGPPPLRGKKKLIGVPGQPGIAVPARPTARPVDAVPPTDGQVN